MMQKATIFSPFFYRALLVCSFLFCVFTLFRPVTDSDWGWHYRYGEYIVNNQKIPVDNLFSYTMADYKWADSYWLAQVIMYSLYGSVGNLGLGLVFSIVFTSVACAFLLLTKEISRTQKILTLSLLPVVISSFSVVGRPMFFSSVFLFFEVWLLRYRPKYVALLPILFMVWANMHADYMLGLFILGLYVFRGTLSRQMPAIKEVVLLLLSFFATFVTPYQGVLWHTMSKEFNITQFQNISEWLPVAQFYKTGFSNYMFLALFNMLVYMFLAFALVSCVYPALLAAKSKQSTELPADIDRNKLPGETISLRLLLRRIEPQYLWYTLALFTFFALSLKAMYFVRVLSLTSVFGATQFISELPARWALNMAGGNSKFLKTLVALTFFMAFLLSCESFVIRAGKTFDENKMWKDAGYPVDAVAFIKENKPLLKGNMFNIYNWGGYLINNLPEYKTFIDGRMTSWSANGTSIFSDYVNIEDKPKENMRLFQSYVDKYNVGWMLDYKDSKLVKALTIEGGGWSKVYEDKLSVVLVKE